MDSKDILEINQLILAAIDGTIAPDDFARLDDWIGSDPDAANHYVEFMTLYAGLRQPGQVSTFFSEPGNKSDSGLDMQIWNELASFEKIAEKVEQEPPAQIDNPVPMVMPRTRPRISRLAIYTSLLSTAALLFMAAFVYFNPRTTGSVVGVLAEAVNAQWQNNMAPAEVGHDLRTGILTLERGLAQVQFDGGASVILEGPAQVNLLTSNSMTLLHGKVVATVGRNAVGFVVNTPQGKILDLGTEFGIEVEAAGQSQVHVFQGEVVLYPTDSETRQNVSQGHAKSVDQTGRVRDIPLRTTAFVRAEEMVSRLLAHRGNSYYRWKSRVYEIHRDASLVAHYFCDKDDVRSSALPNTAATNVPAGQFGGDGREAPVWVEGRWPQKRGVRFEREKNQAILIGADANLSINGPVTIAAWVNFPDETQMGGHLISCRQDSHVNYQFSVFDDSYTYENQRNRFEFLRFEQKKESGCYSREFHLQPKRWYHFAMTYNQNAICFYVDGKLFESKPYVVRQDAKTTEIIIGAMKWNGSYVLPKGDFDGIIDELMIFNRSLGSDAIQTLYEAGMPAEGSAH